jgi:hypothetical protein
MDQNISEHLDTALDAVPQLSKELDLQGLACLEACSKRLQSSVHTIVVREGLRLLDSALDEARHKEQQRKHAVCWFAAVLLRNAPDTAAHIATRLLPTPKVLLEAAKRVVSAGMRVTYAQLLAAADDMVAGVEVWVQAQQQLGVNGDVPAAAIALCCGEEWVSDAISVGLLGVRATGK